MMVCHVLDAKRSLDLLYNNNNDDNNNTLTFLRQRISVAVS